MFPILILDVVRSYEGEAEERMLELKQEHRKTRGTRKIFEVIDVEFNENIDEQLGGFVI